MLMKLLWNPWQMCLTIWNQIIMRNINNLGYVRRRILNFTYKNPFRKRVLKCHLDANNSNCCLVLLSQNMCCTSHMLSIVSNTPKVPLKLQSVHFQNFLSTISTPNKSFRTKIRWHDVRCNKKKEKHMKKKLCVHGKYHLPFVAYLSTQSSFCFMVASTFSWSSQASFTALISLF
jgi:hypothetical protein